MKSLFATGTLDRKEVDTAVILLSAPVLLTLYRYHGSVERFGSSFPVLRAAPLGEVYAVLGQFLSFFVLVLVIPLLFATLRLRRPLSALGFGLGDRSFGFRLLLIGLPLLVLPLAYLASGTPDVQREYPLAKALFTRHDLIVWYEGAYVIFYYIAWEFYFRGFLLFPLADRFGGAAAVCIQTVSSCLVHIGKPEAETLGSIIAGIVFGVIALRTRSFWYGFVLHAAMGVLTDLFILFSRR